MKLEKKIEYWSNGNIDYEYFVDELGRVQGEYKEYYSNGNLFRTGFFKDDKQHRKWTWYDEDGSVDEIRYYWEGKKVSKSEFVFRSKVEGSK